MIGNRHFYRYTDTYFFIPSRECNLLLQWLSVPAY